MTTIEKYQSDYESHLPYRVYFRRTVRYRITHERFVVPWQLQENKKEEPEKE